MEVFTVGNFDCSMLEYSGIRMAKVSKLFKMEQPQYAGSLKIVYLWCKIVLHDHQQQDRRFRKLQINRSQ